MSAITLHPDAYASAASRAAEVTLSRRGQLKLPDVGGSAMDVPPSTLLGCRQVLLDARGGTAQPPHLSRSVKVSCCGAHRGRLPLHEYTPLSPSQPLSAALLLVVLLLLLSDPTRQAATTRAAPSCKPAVQQLTTMATMPWHDRYESK